MRIDPNLFLRVHFDKIHFLSLNAFWWGCSFFSQHKTVCGCMVLSHWWLAIWQRKRWCTIICKYFAWTQKCVGNSAPTTFDDEKKIWHPFKHTIKVISYLIVNFFYERKFVLRCYVAQLSQIGWNSYRLRNKCLFTLLENKLRNGSEHVKICAWALSELAFYLQPSDVFN